jgi:transglutaminase-like putative cysteine protease
VARTLAAALLPAAAVTAAWLRLEDPRRVWESAGLAALALVPALVRPWLARVMALVATGLGAVWMAFGAQPWELLPYRDEHVVGPSVRETTRGLSDFYAVFLPFEPDRNPEMHSLVLLAIFGFTAALALLVAERRPIAAAAVTVAGVGWPTTLIGGKTIGIGAAALAAALAIPLILRASSARTLVAGAAIGALVIGGAVWASSATTLARSAAVDWESWNIGGTTRQASGVQFIWSSNYDGIKFPRTKTVVLEVDGPKAPTYWRTTTLDLFTRNHWFEDLFWLDQVDTHTRALQLAQLIPTRAANQRNWLEQRVQVEALVDDHLAAAGTPVGLDARRLGTVFLLSDGVLRVRDPVREGTSYRVWSYAPDPEPRTLAAAPVRYPPATGRFLEIDGREFPVFGTPDRDRIVEGILDDASYATLAPQRPLYLVAQRVAGKARTPYEAVLALESWFRQTGGFRYDESPPHVKGGPPLVVFVTRTKAGYCQHFAGAMAAMLRMLGVPARVAVGFTSGTNEDGTWVVTDHDAHAWVEAWFAGLGWIAFDPTPGRGTFGGEYSFASQSDAAVAALRKGELSRATKKSASRVPDASDLIGATSQRRDRAPSLVAVALVLAAGWILVVGLGKALLRRSRYLSRDPRRVATASRRELEGFLRDQGVAIAPGTTLVDLQRAVHEELGLDGRPFTAAVARARFGPPRGSVDSAASAKRELRALLRRARRELSLWARFRGFASLRSVRGEAGS